MKKKIIKILSSFNINGKWYKKDEEFVVTILSIGFSGETERSKIDGAVLGYVTPTAIVEFEDGAISSFEINNRIRIIKNAE